MKMYGRMKLSNYTAVPWTGGCATRTRNEFLLYPGRCATQRRGEFVLYHFGPAGVCNPKPGGVHTLPFQNGGCATQTQREFSLYKFGPAGAQPQTTGSLYFTIVDRPARNPNAPGGGTSPFRTALRATQARGKFVLYHFGETGGATQTATQ